MKDNLAHARGWFLKAESDLATTQQMLVGEGPYDTACFHAQQAIEKFLKGFLAYKNQTIPHIHNLEELQLQCLAAKPELDIKGVDLAMLTSYAVEMRYDFEFWPDCDIASQAMDTAKQVQVVIYMAASKAVPPSR